MVPLKASLNTKMDHSCNWRCCFGCKEQAEEPKEPHPSPVDQRVQEVATNQLVRSPEMLDLRVAHQQDSELDVEFDAVHVHIKRTPDHTPRKEQ